MRTRTIVLAALLAAALFLNWQQRTEAPPPADGKFILVDAAERALDGAPALALTFSQPLDPRRACARGRRLPSRRADAGGCDGRPGMTHAKCRYCGAATLRPDPSR